MADYSKGKIYKICNTVTDDVYIGSTTQPLCNRMADHRKKHLTHTSRPLYNKMSELGVDKFFIELVEAYPCQSKNELTAREGHHARRSSTLNKNIPGRTIQQYNDDHKGQHKEYREAHKEQIKEHMAEWYLKNKEHVLQKQGEVFECDCGMTLTMGHKSRHFKSTFHLNAIKKKTNLQEQ